MRQVGRHKSTWDEIFAIARRSLDVFRGIEALETGIRGAGLETDNVGAPGKQSAEIPPTAAHHVSIAFAQAKAKA